MGVFEAVRAIEGGLEVDVSVSPRSDRSGAGGIDEWRERIILRVKAPPLDGRANKEVEDYLGKVTGCRCRIVRGKTSRQKTVAVYGDVDSIMESLRSIL